jgi:acetolactate synthase I/II/III large subunit
MVLVNELSDLDALAAALRAPGPMVALVRTSLEAVLPRRIKAEQSGAESHA